MRDVAAKAGVSVGTVSNVYNRPAKVSKATYNRVQRAINELGFSRNEAARQLRSGTSRAIGLIVMDASNPFFSDLARGVERVADELGLTVLLGNSGGDTGREERYLEQFEEQRVRGILVSPVGDLFPTLERLRLRGIPSVLVDRSAVGTSFSSVSVDDKAGGRLAVEHLLNGGDRRLCFVGNPNSVQQIKDRFLGAEATVREHMGSKFEVIVTDGSGVQDGIRAALEILSRDLESRPQGVFCANDVIAVGFVHGLKQSGEVNIPEDIRVIGYDDISFSEAAAVAISSIRQPSMSIGEAALRILEDEASGKRVSPLHLVFHPELIPRASSTRKF